MFPFVPFFLDFIVIVGIIISIFLRGAILIREKQFVLSVIESMPRLDASWFYPVVSQVTS